MTRILNLRSAGRAVLKLGTGWKHTRPARGAAHKVGRVVADLENLNGATERDFLAVGDKLMKFRASAREISSDMAAITELIAGEQGRNASGALDQLLAQSREMDAGIERSGQALANVRELSGRLRKVFAGLPNMVAMFRSLCTLTQIETARLGGAGADLGHLASEIRPLSESIQANGESVVASSNRLDKAVQRAMRSGVELRATQLKQMPVLIASVLASLQSFEERRGLALESSQRQAAEYAAVSEAIEDLVGSIQFHDITRQQLEHVLEALRRLRSGMAGTEAVYSPLETQTILRLQHSQLDEAERLFIQSMERMDRNLESISGRLQNAAEEVQKLAGASGDGHESFFEKMETQFQAIGKLLGTCTAARRDIESTAGGLARTIAEMRASVADIRGTEIQIQRISTNATIRATHIGSSGVALNKIAEVMQRLALDSNSSTEEAAAALDGMSEATGRIAPPDGEDNPGTTSDANAMQQALAGLHSSRESSASRVDHVAQTSAQLAREIAALRSSLSARRLFAEVAGRARAELESLGAQAGEHSSAGATDAGMAHLQHLASTYTMQRQRDVHETVMGSVQAPTPSVEPTATGGDSDLGASDLGANVDLF